MFDKERSPFSLQEKCRHKTHLEGKCCNASRDTLPARVLYPQSSQIRKVCQ
jgi:hypothetical protein